MGDLKDRLQRDLSAAIKSRDGLRTRTLRLALAAIRNEEVAGKQARDLSDDDVIKVLGREAKKRREAAEAFESGGRPEQAEQERAEGTVLGEYLPAQLGDDELRELVTAAIAETGVGDPKGMGQVMRVLTPRTAGRADGGRVAAEVRRQLGG
ncbi:MAG: GatB/YqeY domain-containing protein [Streptosporangiales bacterium]|nr:GatB/YqeY domain-containing protein [Streptosporangiales bacterium]